MLPAMAAILARIGPVIEAVMASGAAGSAASAGAGLGASGAATGGAGATTTSLFGGQGIAGFLGQLLGAPATGAAGTSGAATGGGGSLAEIASTLLKGPAPFASGELGPAIQRLEDIAALQQTLRESAAKLQGDQVETATRFREDERLYMMGNPEDTKKLAEIEKQRVANTQQQSTIARESFGLEGRVKATTNPPSPLQNLGRAAGVVGTAASLGSLAVSMLPNAPAASPGLAGQVSHAFGDAVSAPLGPLGGLVRKLPQFAVAGNVMQAGLQPIGDLAIGREEGQVAGSAAGFAAKSAQIAFNPMAMMRGEGIAHMARLPGLIKDWGEALVESKRGLVQFNGTIAMAFADAERRGIVRSIESGAVHGGATAGLSDALQDLYDVVQPMKDSVTIVLTSAAEAGVRGIANIVIGLGRIYSLMEKMSPALGYLEEILEWLGKRDKPDTLPLEAFIRDIKGRPVGSIPRVPPRPGGRG